MTDEPVLFSVEDRIAYLTPNRPAKHNVITAAKGGDIAKRARQIETDPAIKVLVMHGAGGRVFSSGADVNALDDLGTPSPRRYAD